MSNLHPPRRRGQAARADALGNAGSEDLLGAAAADAEEEFKGGAVGERARQGLQLAEYVVDFAIPEGFCGTPVELAFRPASEHEIWAA